MGEAHPVESWDFIVVGAGSAGCALAARLSESGAHRVLLVEAGEDDRWIWLRIPTGVARVLVGERAVWRFQTEPEPGLGGRTIFCPRGRVLGGTAGVNGMFWVWGYPAVFDAWRAAGNTGWGYDEVVPLLRRMEAYARGDPARRGRSGPLAVTAYAPRDPLTDAFLAACTQAGIPESTDYNADGCEGAGVMQFSTKRGLRWGVREGYLRPAMKRGNLRVLTGARATRVLLEGGRATGVEIRHGERLIALRAAREVALCAGAFQSPQLLELSGIGDARVLQRHGIEVKQPLPSVGENLRDHLQARVMFEARGLATLNDILPSFWKKARMALRYALFRDGLMSVPGATAHAYARLDPASAQPDVKLQLHHLTSPDERNPKRVLLDDFPGFSIGVVQQQPASRGSVHLRSADPFDAPEIRANFLSAEEDLRAVIEGVRLARRVAAQPALARFVVREVRPGPGSASDTELADYLRSTIFGSYHQVGTCRMGADADAVVDPRLRVRGVAGLRVADASVLPSIPASNTNAAAVLVGEKAAELMLADARSVA
ncbi:MAG: GMC family oxidoreductase N-terminal domain-containing protein [Betaproteobacteria bacterium]|nr:GMC family oxidoreductase N-terminal domain-containing protein [Betaproteobacteria bacterium]